MVTVILVILCIYLLAGALIFYNIAAQTEEHEHIAFWFPVVWILWGAWLILLAREAPPITVAGGVLLHTWAYCVLVVGIGKYDAPPDDKQGEE